MVDISERLPVPEEDACVGTAPTTDCVLRGAHPRDGDVVVRDKESSNRVVSQIARHEAGEHHARIATHGRVVVYRQRIGLNVPLQIVTTRFCPSSGRAAWGKCTERSMCAYAERLLLRFCRGLDPERLRRFEQEAMAAAALNHPNILAVYQDGHA